MHLAIRREDAIHVSQCGSASEQMQAGHDQQPLCISLNAHGLKMDMCPRLYQGTHREHGCMAAYPLPYRSHTH